MVKTPSFLHHSRKLACGLSWKGWAPVVCGRQKGTCWRPAGYVHPTLEANAAGEENLKVIQMVGCEHPLVRRDPRIIPVVFPAPHWSFSSLFCKSPPAPAPWRGLLWPPVLSSLLLTILCVPFRSTYHNQKLLYWLFICLGVLAFCLSSPVNQSSEKDGTMPVLPVTVSPGWGPSCGRQEV